MVYRWAMLAPPPDRRPLDTRLTTRPPVTDGDVGRYRLGGGYASIPSLATPLSAAFLLGCQDLGSGPVVPEDLGIQAAKGHKGKAEKTNTTAEVALESIGTEVDHRNIELASSPVPWTSARQ